jgi:hypothetical protein
MTGQKFSVPIGIKVFEGGGSSGNDGFIILISSGKLHILLKIYNGHSSRLIPFR